MGKTGPQWFSTIGACQIQRAPALFILQCVSHHNNFVSMNETQALIHEIECAASDLGIAPSTVGERAGQGGHFYRRLKGGHRFWPETADKVRAWIAAERARRAQSEGASA